jgi:hypothetical protein
MEWNRIELINKNDNNYIFKNTIYFFINIKIEYKKYKNSKKNHKSFINNNFMHRLQILTRQISPPSLSNRSFSLFPSPASVIIIIYILLLLLLLLLLFY